MWLYLIAAALIVIGLFGGIFAGGIFTIVLVPVAVLILFSGVVYSWLARAAEEKAGTADRNNHLPHRRQHPSGQVST